PTLPQAGPSSATPGGRRERAALRAGRRAGCEPSGQPRRAGGPGAQGGAGSQGEKETHVRPAPECSGAGRTVLLAVAREGQDVDSATLVLATLQRTISRRRAGRRRPIRPPQTALTYQGFSCQTVATFSARATQVAVISWVLRLPRSSFRASAVSARAASSTTLTDWIMAGNSTGLGNEVGYAVRWVRRGGQTWAVWPDPVNGTV